MSSKKKIRDQSGRFVPEEEISQERTLWRRFRTIVIFSVMLLLSIPWSVIIFEPAKNYGTHFADYVGNVTSSLRENVCSCRISPPCKSSL